MTWERLNVCMGGKDICHSGDLVGNDRARHITSFGEDGNGKLKIAMYTAHINKILLLSRRRIICFGY